MKVYRVKGKGNINLCFKDKIPGTRYTALLQAIGRIVHSFLGIKEIKIFILSYTSIHFYTLLYTSIHFYILLYTSIHFYTLLANIR